MLETGIDIIEVARIKKSIQASDRFKKRIFHPNEIDYCKSGSTEYQHYSARFAAKEVTRKILLSYLPNNILKWDSIWIENEKNGFLFKKGNSEDLKEKINKLLRMKNSRIMRIQTNARKKVKQFSLKEIIKKIERTLIK